MPAPRSRSSPGRDPGQRPGEKLATYQRKRDFARTPEPPGAPSSAAAPRPGARRFVVQRHRARRLHYDFRLEVDGVLVSWAVPKGPTLDPGVRRAAFHVEDHPLEYIDFEGVIPAGEYGGGDVIVWDAGTWEPHDAGDPPDPGRALGRGELHVDLYGEKLRGRFILVRTRPDASGRDGWLLLHKHDEYAVDGWDAEDHPRSVKTGRTNDEVKADPDRMWRSDLPAARASVALKAPPAAPDPDALRELDGFAATGLWHVYGRELRVTNLDKVLFPARAGEEPVTKRDLLRYTAQVAPVVLPYLARRALNMHRYPNGAQAKGFWQKELPSHAPDWLPRWDNPEAAPSESRTYLVVDEPAALIWAANFGALEWHPWTSLVEAPHKPTYALIDLDPGGQTSWDDLLALARLHRTAFDHLGLRAQPKVTGRRGIQIWVPIARGPDFDATRDWVERLSKTVGAVAPDLVSWKWQVGERGGRARLDYTQNAINKTLVAPYSPRPAPVPRSPPRSSGTSWTIPRCGRTASPSVPCWTGSTGAATCSARCYRPISDCRRWRDRGVPAGAGCGRVRPRPRPPVAAPSPRGAQRPGDCVCRIDAAVRAHLPHRTGASLRRVSSFTVTPVGSVASERSDPGDSDHWGAVVSTIVIDERFGDDCLSGLADFSHVEVVFHFDRLSGRDDYRPRRRPRGRADLPEVGVFADRGPRRPNRIGCTICEVLSAEGRRLRVRGLDAVDGTPVLDIKPVMRQFVPARVEQPSWVDALMSEYFRD